MATPLRALPRNTRRAELAQRVGQRAQARPHTPTPPPAVVRARDAASTILEIKSTISPPPPRVPRLLLLAVAMVGLIALVGVRHVRSGAPAFSTSSSLLSWRPLAASYDELRTDPFFDRVLGDADAPAANKPADNAQPSDLIELRRDGHVPVPGGILVFPSSFKPQRGEPYDLYIHFHGNTAVVKESIDVAQINAAVVIINFGIGSAPYEEYYNVPGTYEELLDAVNVGLTRRGVPHPRLGRVALSAWSAGYGSIATIHSLRRGREDLDAILVFDGIHAGWEGDVLNPRQMKPFVDLAKRAAFGGEIYFGMTHSAIDPMTYAGTEVTAKHLVKQVGATMEPRDAAQDAPAYVSLESMKGAVSKKLEKTMMPTNEARKLNFRVLGYEGETKEHHMAHLFQMSATLLPDLRARWAR